VVRLRPRQNDQRRPDPPGESGPGPFRCGEISRLDLGSFKLQQVTAELARLDAQVKAEAALRQLKDAMQRSAEPLEWSEKLLARHDLPGSGGAVK
jgi:hypothetical protein